MKRSFSKFAACIVLVVLMLNMTAFAQYYKNDLTGIAVNISDNWSYEYSDDESVGYTYKYDDSEYFNLYFANTNSTISSAHEITDDDMYNICMSDMSDEALASELSEINNTTVNVKNESTVIDRIYIGGRPFISLSKAYTATASGYNPLYGFSAAYVCVENSKMVVLVYNRTSDSNHFSDIYDMLSTISIPQSASATVTSSVDPYASSSGDIKIKMNGEYVYPDSAPVMESDRVLVPIRVIAEKMGYTVTWDEAFQCVMIENPYKTVIMFMYNPDYLIDGGAYHMDVPPRIIGERTYIPLRAAAEALGASVDWDDASQTVLIWY